MACEAFKDLPIRADSKKVLCNGTFDIAQKAKINCCQRGFVNVFIKNLLLCVLIQLVMVL